MPDDKNFFAGLVDFSFQQQLMRRLVKVLYIIGILAGGICGECLGGGILGAQDHVRDNADASCKNANNIKNVQEGAHEQLLEREMKETHKGVRIVGQVP